MYLTIFFKCIVKTLFYVVLFVIAHYWLICNNVSVCRLMYANVNFAMRHFLISLKLGVFIGSVV